MNFHEFRDFCSCLQTLRPLNHQANKLSRSSSVQNMNSLNKISGLTAAYCFYMVTARVMTQNVSKQIRISTYQLKRKSAPELEQYCLYSGQFFENRLYKSYTKCRKNASKCGGSTLYPLIIGQYS